MTNVMGSTRKDHGRANRGARPSSRAESSGNASFAIEAAIVEERATLVAYGDVGRDAVPQFSATLDALVLARVSCLTVDLSETTSVDFAVLKAIIQARGVAPQVLVRLPEAGGLDVPRGDGESPSTELLKSANTRPGSVLPEPSGDLGLDSRGRR